MFPADKTGIFLLTSEMAPQLRSSRLLATWYKLFQIRRLLTNPHLSSHAFNQFLGIVADPGFEHRLDVLDLVNAH